MCSCGTHTAIRDFGPNFRKTVMTAISHCGHIRHCDSASPVTDRGLGLWAGSRRRRDVWNWLPHTNCTVTARQACTPGHRNGRGNPGDLVSLTQAPPLEGSEAGGKLRAVNKNFLYGF